MDTEASNYNKSADSPVESVSERSQHWACFKAVAAKNQPQCSQHCGSWRLLRFTSAALAVRASDRPAAGHPAPDFVAADQASDLVGRPGSAGRLAPDCSCDFFRLGLK
jgi:hypothetical protein